MEPSLHGGDVLFVLNKNLVRIKKKNIIIFRKNKTTMVKRISKITGSGVEVRGDNGARSRDSRVFGKVQKTDILGKVIKTIHSHS